MADPVPQNPAPAPQQPQAVQPAPQPVVPAAPVQEVQQAAQNVQQGAQDASQSVQQAGQAAQQGVQNASQAVTGGLQQGMDALKGTGVTDLFKVAENQPKVNSTEKLWAMVSYIPLVAVLALLISGESKYVRLHGRQGLLVFLIFFFCIFVYLVPFIGPLFGGLIQFALFVLGVFSMYQALIGNWWKIPVLGDVAEMIPIDFFTTITKEVVTGQAAPQDAPTGEDQPQQAAQEPPQQPTPPSA
ncbi:hypothetical protein IT413_05410 [Candidatus Peregrinibacteria bacterium]|nr:hypothetical protein [Candidatus Peregrinibacteria bacterium]